MANENLDLTLLGLFARNNKRLNSQMNNIIKTLTEEEWDKIFPSYWKSIHEICSHVFTADTNWLNIFKLFENAKIVNGEYFAKDYDWGEKSFGNCMNDYLKMRNELDNKIIDFIGKLKNEDLEKYMGLPDGKGNICSMKYSTYQ